MWSRNGQELFYRAGDRLLSVAVTRGATFTVSKPRLLFEVKLGLTQFPTQADYDVAAEGDRFVMIRLRGEQPPVTQLEIALNVTGSQSH